MPSTELIFISVHIELANKNCHVSKASCLVLHALSSSLDADWKKLQNSRRNRSRESKTESTAPSELKNVVSMLHLELGFVSSVSTGDSTARALVKASPRKSTYCRNFRFNHSAVNKIFSSLLRTEISFFGFSPELGASSSTPFMDIEP